MTVRSTFGSFLLCTLLAGAAAAQDVSSGDVRAAEEALATALVTKDRAALDRLLAPEFVLRGAPDVPRGAWLQNAVSLCWGDRYEVSDFTIARSQGDTVIASLLLTTFRDPESCEPATIRSLLTDVWIRRNSGLQLALRHAGAPGSVTAQFAKVAPPPPRWERSAELSAVATGGNTATQTLGAAGSVTFRAGTWETRGRVAFVRSAAEDVTTAESFIAELRQSRTLSPRLQVFGRADYLVNRFAGIDYRLTGDGGLAWTVFDAPGGSLVFDGGLGVTREARLAGGDQAFGAGILGILAKWRPGATTHIEDRTLVSTDLGAIGNWRLQNTASLSVSMTRILSLRLSHDLKRIARPVIGFEKTDTILAAALVARF